MTLLPTTAPELRDYQREAVEQIDAAVADGARAPLLVMPTGAGKTRPPDARPVRAPDEHGARTVLAGTRGAGVSRAGMMTFSKHAEALAKHASDVTGGPKPRIRLAK